LIARRYLQPLVDSQVDTVVLGCTHYPLLKPVLQHILGPDVTLIDSGQEETVNFDAFLTGKGQNFWTSFQSAFSEKKDLVNHDQ